MAFLALVRQTNVPLDDALAGVVAPQRVRQIGCDATCAPLAFIPALAEVLRLSPSIPR
jgi:hypothetical protein